MDITLHEEFYGQKSLNQEAVDASLQERIVPKKQTIATIMAYSRALSIQCYETLGQEETILN
jgi:hypothetical protein